MLTLTYLPHLTMFRKCTKPRRGLFVSLYVILYAVTIPNDKYEIARKKALK
jgi:hypothetical protein